MIESNKDVATHDEKPEMKVAEITESTLKAIESDKYQFIAINLTNCDMVGHSGRFDAVVKAVEAVDQALGVIAGKCSERGYDMIITADHGNAEETFREGQPMTSHTLNKVPFYLLSDRFDRLNAITGDLSDIAPTILELLALEKPSVMTGKSLV